MNGRKVLFFIKWDLDKSVLTNAWIFVFFCLKHTRLQTFTGINPIFFFSSLRIKRPVISKKQLCENLPLFFLVLLPLPWPPLCKEKKWLLDETCKICSSLSYWFNFYSWISKEFCNSLIWSSPISLDSSIKHTTKLNFSVDDLRIFSMMVISFILSLWIHILLTIFIVYEK